MAQRFCQTCGAELEADAGFCALCGASTTPSGTATVSLGESTTLPETPVYRTNAPQPAGYIENLPAPSLDPAFIPQQRTAEFQQVEPAPKTSSGGKAKAIVAVVIAAAIVVGAGGGIAIAANVSNAKQSADTAETSGSGSETSSSAVQTTVNSSASGSGSAGSSSAGDSTASASGNSASASGSSATSSASSASPAQQSTVGKVHTEQVLRDTAQDFATVYWTNVGADGAGYVEMTNWRERCLAYVAAGTSLYSEISGGSLDAEDIAVSATANSVDGNVVNVTVNVAANRENHVSGWEKQITHTYTMDITLNDEDMVTGFVSHYTDPETGYTSSLAH